MKMRIILSLVLAGLLMVSDDLYAENKEKMQVPSGYSLRMLDDINGSVLIPDGWYYSREIRSNFVGYFISKQEIKGGGIYTTGLSIQVNLNLHGVGRTSVEGIAMVETKKCVNNKTLDVTNVWNI